MAGSEPGDEDGHEYARLKRRARSGPLRRELWLVGNDQLMGVNQYDDSFVTMLMDPMAGGWGAQSYQDGVDTGGLLSTPRGQAPNVESNELSFPMLHLYRREEPESGGPGEYRG